MRHSQNARHSGTCTWILNCDEYLRWSDSSRSAVLWAHGKAGSGKTILSGWVHEHQTPIVTKLQHTVLLSYLCDFTEEDSLYSQTVLQSFVKQMLLNLGQKSTPENLLDALELLVENNKSVDFEDLLDTFFKVGRLFAQIRIILDGSDECDNRSKSDLLRWISRASAFPDSVIKIYVSSRNDIDIKHSLRLYPEISLAASQPVADLETYISEQVELLKSKGKLKFNNQKLYKKVVEKLTLKSDRMYVSLGFTTIKGKSLILKMRPCYEICDCATDSEVEDTLDQLPIGLHETYERGLKKILFHSNLSKSALRKSRTTIKLYNWIYHAKRPLTIDELMEAIAITVDDRRIPTQRIATGDDRWKIIKRCGNLLEYDEADNTVTFFHYTLKQYITELGETTEPHKSQELSNNESLKDIARSIGLSGEIIAQICVTYLSFSDFETAVAPFQESSVQSINNNMELIQELASTVAISSLSDNLVGRGINSVLRGFRLMNGLFEGEAPVTRAKVNFARYTYILKPPPQSILYQFKLLEYVKTFWLQHCCVLELDRLIIKKRCYNDLLKLCFEKDLLFDIRPWGKRYSSRAYPDTDAFVWAVENDHSLLVDMILRKSDMPTLNEYYRTITLPDGTTMAHIAAAHPTEDMFKLIMEGHNSSVPTYFSFFTQKNQTDSYHRNFLRIACLHGSLSVVRYLISNFHIPSWEEKDIYGNTPLDCAIENGEADLIEALIEGLRPRFGIDGWHLDGKRSYKLEKFFILLCSAGRNNLYLHFESSLTQWLRTVVSQEWEATKINNKTLLKGIQHLLETHNIYLLRKIFSAMPTSFPGPIEFKNFVIQAFQLSVDLEIVEFSQELLRFKILFAATEFQERARERPVNYKELNYLTRLTPYPAAIPRLLARLYDISNYDDIQFVPPWPIWLVPDKVNLRDIGDAILDRNSGPFHKALGTQFREHNPPSKGFYMFSWQNLLLAINLDIIALFTKENGSILGMIELDISVYGNKVRDLLGMANGLLSLSQKYQTTDFITIGSNPESSIQFFTVALFTDMIQIILGTLVAIEFEKNFTDSLPVLLEQLRSEIIILGSLTNALPRKDLEDMLLSVYDPQFLLSYPSGLSGTSSPSTNTFSSVLLWIAARIIITCSEAEIEGLSFVYPYIPKNAPEVKPPLPSDPLLENDILEKSYQSLKVLLAVGADPLMSVNGKSFNWFRTPYDVIAASGLPGLFRNTILMLFEDSSYMRSTYPLSPGIIGPSNINLANYGVFENRLAHINENEKMGNFDKYWKLLKN
ncbi:hypothetical protein AA313_de0201017 [Arthrobotrys entomopaga]|nr:hypothetical protein AA313_de0201017 [Arthrobotrys entomopaga]